MGVTKFEVGDVVRCIEEDKLGGLLKGSEHTVLGVDEMGHLSLGLMFLFRPDRFELVRRAKDAKQVPSDWEIGDVLEYVGPEGRGLVPRTFYRLMHPSTLSDEMVVRGEINARVHQCAPHLFKNLTAAERAAKGALVDKDHREDAARYIGLGHEEPAVIRGAIESGRLKLHPIQKHFLEGLRGQKATGVFMDESREPTPALRCGACNAKLPTVMGWHPSDPLREAPVLDRSKPLGVFAFPLTPHEGVVQERTDLCATCAQSVAQHIAYLKTKNDGFDPDVD